MREISPDWAQLARPDSELSSASLHEAAGKVGALPAGIRPLAPRLRVAGPALPVRCRPGDNLFLHHAIYAAVPGEVLVVDVGPAAEFGHWGDVMAKAAQVRGIAGLVITGGVRDSLRLVSMEFPTFCGCVSIRGTAKDPQGHGAIGEPIEIGGVTVCRGDLVFGDADGVVVVPAAEADRAIERARERDACEEDYARRLEAGDTTLAIYGLPPLVGRGSAARPRRRSIEVDGLAHGSLPIPVASRVGDLIATGGIRGVDPDTGKMPDDAAEQARLMFANLRRAVEAAGAQVGDILKVTIWIATADARAAVNPPWIALFPDAASRPARHILSYDLPAGMLLQCEALAVAPASTDGGTRFARS